MSIASSVAKSIARSVAQAVSSVGGGGVATPFVATPSTATPVAGVDVTWTTNATDFGTPVLYMWDFGDGTIPVTGATPAHYFVGLGPYTVTCVVTYDDDSTKTGTVVITPIAENVVTLTNEPYKPGTDLGSLTTWDNLNGTRIPVANQATAPDGTFTADLYPDGTGYPVAELVAHASATDYTLVAYFKDVNRRYVFMSAIYGGYASAGFDLQEERVCWSLETGTGYKIRGASINAVGSGWYRCSMTFQADGTNGSFIRVGPGDGPKGMTHYGGSSADYDGTGYSFYCWGANWFAGKDTYDPNFDYLGAIQDPAPTSTLESPLPAVNMKRISYEPFSAIRGSSALGDFDGWSGLDVKIVPVGAKLLSEDGIGWSAFYGQSNWAGTWTLTSMNELFHCYVYFHQLPEGTINYITVDSGSGTNRIYAVDSSGNIVKIVNGTPTTIKSGGIVPKQWYWFGLAASGSECSFLLRELGSDIELLSTASMLTDRVAYTVSVGTLAGTGTAHYSRVSAISRHHIRTVEDAAYPNEIAPPQDENFIYQVDPVSGDDANNGVDSPWQTITKTNAMMGVDGVISNAPAATVKTECGRGSWLRIDTSSGLLDLEDVGLHLKMNSVWLQPSDGLQTAELKAYVEVAPGSWSATGGYSNIYQVAVSEPVQTTVFGDNVCFEPVANLAALDAAAGGASWLDVSGQLLHIKTLGLTNPGSDGITYRYGRHRTTGDTVGFPAISVAAADCRVSDFKIWYTANNQNGNYAIGDIAGFSNMVWVERVSSKYSCKHGICFTQNATDSTIYVDDCDADLSWTYPYTSFMLTGSGNVHNYTGCTSDVALLQVRSATGTPNNTHGNGPGAFYCHGGSTYDSINFSDCVFGGSIELEFASALVTLDAGCTVQFVRSGNPVDITGATLRDVIPFTGGTVTGLIVVTGNAYTTVWGMEGSITGSTFDLRTLATQAIGLWTLTGATTFTGNTIRFAAGQSSPIIKDSAASDIVSWNNNTYYIEAAAVFAKDFDDGGGADDYTFAQWQALGYDAASTRIDP